MNLDKKQIYIFAIISVLIIAGFAAVSYFEEGSYDNEDIGLHFDYPGSWELERDTLIRSDDERKAYWIKLSGPNGEISFDISPHFEGGFVLSEESQDQYEKLKTLDGTDIWRPVDSIIFNGEERPSPISYFSSENEGRRSFRFIFPEFGRVNNVGNVFDSAREGFGNGSFDIAISAGVDVTSSSTFSEALEEVDRIISSIVFEKPEADSFESFNIDKSLYDVRDWKTYENEEYGFSFKYPEEYGDFNPRDRSSDGDLSLIATSSSAELIYGQYNQYPDLLIKVESIEEYSFDNIYDGIYRYDKEEEVCISESFVTGETRERPFSVSYNNWQGCKIGVGDAGYSNKGYAIPYPEKDIVLEITQRRNPGMYRPYDINLTLETLRFN